MTPERLKKGLERLPLWVGSQDGTKISRSFVAKNFVEALAFLNEVGALAEKEGVRGIVFAYECIWLGGTDARSSS